MKLSVVLSAILFLLVCILGCSDRGTEATNTTSPGQFGKVSLSFASAPQEITQVVARLTRSGYTTLVMNLTVSDSTHASGSFNNVAVGLWHLTVEARDSSNVVRYSGETDVNVIGGQTTHVSLQLLATNGQIAITVTWGSSPLPTAGLMAYYPFIGNTNDQSGGGHHGVLYGATLTADRFGIANRAYSFDGVDDYVDIPNTNSWNFTSGFTLVAWANFNQNNADAQILSKHNWGLGSGYILNVFNNRHCFYVNSDPRVSAPLQSNDGLWHMIAGVYDGTTAFLYVDGVLVNSRLVAYTNTNATSVKIGAVAGAGYFKGRIDDARMYSRALSLPEIQTLYHEGGW